MMSHSQPQTQKLSRDQFLLLLQSAINTHQTRFCLSAAGQWLQNFPGDLEVRYLEAYAQACDPERKAVLSTEALALVEDLCVRDPEYVLAQELRTFLAQSDVNSNLSLVEGTLRGLSGERQPLLFPAYKTSTEEWSDLLWSARQALAGGQAQEADGFLSKLLEGNKMAGEVSVANIPLVGVTHLQIVQQRAGAEISADSYGVLTLADIYHKRWPDCLPISLILAVALMDGGEPQHGVALLHEAAAQDNAGQVAARLWGKNHPYRKLWPENMSIELSEAIPASVAAALGWNRLTHDPQISASSFQPAGEISEQGPPQLPPAQTPAAPVSEDGATPVSGNPAVGTPVQAHGLPASTEQENILHELGEIAHHLNQPHLARADGRMPVYVVLSTRQGLSEQYGAPAFSDVDAALNQIVQAIGRRQGWNAILLYADDPASCAQFGIKPVPARDAWAIKLSLADLDSALGQQGRMIGALLIAGGPEVVPFHILPNPVQDLDVQVQSDNPYTTRDENYFIPEWPAGRIMGGSTQDVQPLLKVIRRITTNHENIQIPSRSWLMSWIELILSFFIPRTRKSNPSLGYSAAVWKDASMEVFKPIGGTREMLVSPPIDSDSFLNGSLEPTNMAYFNLHGVEDAPEWFGQRDPLERYRRGIADEIRLPEDDYPIALRPDNLREGDPVPDFIFSEACYGAFISGTGAFD